MYQAVPTTSEQENEILIKAQKQLEATIDALRHYPKISEISRTEIQTGPGDRIVVILPTEVSRDSLIRKLPTDAVTASSVNKENYQLIINDISTLKALAKIHDIETKYVKAAKYLNDIIIPANPQCQNLEAHFVTGQDYVQIHQTDDSLLNDRYNDDYANLLRVININPTKTAIQHISAYPQPDYPFMNPSDNEKLRRKSRTLHFIVSVNIIEDLASRYDQAMKPRAQVLKESTSSCLTAMWKKTNKPMLAASGVSSVAGGVAAAGIAIGLIALGFTTPIGLGVVATVLTALALGAIAGAVTPPLVVYGPSFLARQAGSLLACTGRCMQSTGNRMQY